MVSNKTNPEKLTMNYRNENETAAFSRGLLVVALPILCFPFVYLGGRAILEGMREDSPALFVGTLLFAIGALGIYCAASLLFSSIGNRRNRRIR